MKQPILPAPTPGFIYLIGSAEQGLAKVGFCRERPELRLAKLQTGNPARLELLAFFPGDRRTEGVIHAALSKWRARGEWFRGIDALESVFTALVHDELGDAIEPDEMPEVIEGVMRELVPAP